MKTLLSSLAIASYLLFCSMSCSKKVVSGPVFTGKVVKSMCGQIAIQFTDGTPLGQMGWIDASDSGHAPYDAIFRVTNSCSWGNKNVGDSIQFRFVQESVQDCAVCMAWTATPDTAYNIKVIE